MFNQLRMKESKVCRNMKFVRIVIMADHLIFRMKISVTQTFIYTLCIYHLNKKSLQ